MATKAVAASSAEVVVFFTHQVLMERHNYQFFDHLNFRIIQHFFRIINIFFRIICPKISTKILIFFRTLLDALSLFLSQQNFKPLPLYHASAKTWEVSIFKVLYNLTHTLAVMLYNLRHACS